MSKVKITGSIEVDINGKQSTNVANSLIKNFGKKEIGNVHSVGEFICFDINAPICLPILITMFSSLQLYTNGNAVNMSMLK